MGWLGLVSDRRVNDAFAPCFLCDAPLRFDVQDPMFLGRTMEQCTNRECAGHVPHPVVRVA